MRRPKQPEVRRIKLRGRRAVTSRLIGEPTFMLRKFLPADYSLVVEATCSRADVLGALGAPREIARRQLRLDVNVDPVPQRRNVSTSIEVNGHGRRHEHACTRRRRTLNWCA